MTAERPIKVTVRVGIPNGIVKSPTRPKGESPDCASCAFFN